MPCMMMPDGKGGELANPWRLDCVIVSHQPIKTVCSYIETNQTFMKLLHAHILSQDPGAVVEVRIFLTTHHDDASDSMYPPIGL